MKLGELGASRLKLWTPEPTSTEGYIWENATAIREHIGSEHRPDYLWLIDWGFDPIKAYHECSHLFPQTRIIWERLLFWTDEKERIKQLPEDLLYNVDVIVLPHSSGFSWYGEGLFRAALPSRPKLLYRHDIESHYRTMSPIQLEANIEGLPSIEEITGKKVKKYTLYPHQPTVEVATRLAREVDHLLIFGHINTYEDMGRWLADNNNVTWLPEVYDSELPALIMNADDIILDSPFDLTFEVKMLAHRFGIPIIGEIPSLDSRLEYMYTVWRRWMHAVTRGRP